MREDLRRRSQAVPASVKPIYDRELRLMAATMGLTLDEAKGNSTIRTQARLRALRSYRGELVR